MRQGSDALLRLDFLPVFMIYTVWHLHCESKHTHILFDITQSKVLDFHISFSGRFLKKSKMAEPPVKGELCKKWVDQS